MRIAFGCDGTGWDEEKVLERYELLCEAGLLRGYPQWLGCQRRSHVRSAIAAAAAPDARRSAARAGQRHRRAAARGQAPAGGIRADARRVHPVRAAEDGGGNPRARTCTSRISAAWWRAAGWSSPPANSACAPAAGRPSSTASAATWCWSGRPPACGSGPDGGDRIARALRPGSNYPLALQQEARGAIPPT